MIIAYLFLLGLALGSFVNALVWRVHEQAKPKAKQVKANLSITKGRSICPHCQHQLGFWDLIPVCSWLWLRGKCRYCHRAISWQYPLVELATALLFVVSYLAWPYDFSAIGIFQFGTWLICLTAFMALLVYDLKWMILPNRIVFPLIAIAALQTLVLAVWQQDIQIIIGGLLGVLCLAGLFYALFQISDGKWIGGGDVKLAVALGLVVSGPVKSFLLLFIAACLGTICSVPALLKGKKATHQLPFGPFLIVATIIVYLFGTSLVVWYKKQFLLL